MSELRARPCQRRCAWRATQRLLDGDRIFACAGCTSEWTAAQPWTPCQADGTVPPAVLAERAMRPS